jgi:hypothetical protein
MAEMLDCLLTYCSEDADVDGFPRRYLAYQVISGPGPVPGGGVASITPLASHDENVICDSCERVIAVKTGGPAAAMEEALIYIKAYHESDGLQKVQSEIRRFPARTDADVR